MKIVVELPDGEKEAFLKPSGRQEVGIEGMANELFAACIAGHLGLPVCEPLIVDIDPEWAENIPDHAVRNVIQRSCPVAFASVSAGSGWRKWQADDHLSVDNRLLAKGIFAFDAFTENPDRLQGKNPNLLVRGNQLRIIDHELSFRLRMQLFPPPRPWEIGNLDRMSGSGGHALCSHIRRSRQPEVAELRPLWAGLTDDILASYTALLPLEWQEAAAAMNDARHHLGTVRDRIDECLSEVLRVLS